MILLFIDLPCGYVFLGQSIPLHYTIEKAKQMLHLAWLSFLIVLWPLDCFSLVTGAHDLHIKVRHDIVID
jgi:hypothetical protein